MAIGVMPTRSATGRIAIAARPSRSRISRAAARIRTAVSVFAGAGIEDAIMSIRRTHEKVYAVYPAPCNRARYRCYRSGLSPGDELTGSQFLLTGVSDNAAVCQALSEHTPACTRRRAHFAHLLASADINLRFARRTSSVESSFGFHFICWTFRINHQC